ncbi:MAG: hypothetical protein ABGY41_01995 [Candidatus Poribacteria bacterium]|jgi:hypothetical protein
MDEALMSGFEEKFAHISARGEERRWLDIPWNPDLWDGRAKAAEAGRPMFIWAMNGDPLGAV